MKRNKNRKKLSQQPEYYMMDCAECGRFRYCKCRGLCHMCYLDLPIRRKHLPMIVHGHGLGNKTPPLADQPTVAMPGTEEKVRIMENRAALGRQIYHPLDAR